MKGRGSVATTFDSYSGVVGGSVTVLVETEQTAEYPGLPM